MDRSTTIGQSLKDVEHTLMLAIGLVILVVFFFLRDIRGHAHTERCGSGVADRHVRRDVPARLQPRQSVAHGAHRGHGIRRRRCHRRAREHLPSRGSRHAPLPGSSPRRPRGHFHRALDEPLARRRLHSDPAHGRHRGTPLPRVRHGAVDRDFGVVGAVPDHDADDVRAPSARQAGTPAGPAVARVRTRLQFPACGYTSGRWARRFPIRARPC